MVEKTNTNHKRTDSDGTGLFVRLWPDARFFYVCRKGYFSFTKNVKYVFTHRKRWKHDFFTQIDRYPFAKTRFGRCGKSNAKRSRKQRQ